MRGVESTVVMINHTHPCAAFLVLELIMKALRGCEILRRAHSRICCTSEHGSGTVQESPPGPQLN